MFYLGVTIGLILGFIGALWQQYVVKSPKTPIIDDGGKVKCPTCKKGLLYFRPELQFCPTCGQVLIWPDYITGRRKIK